MNIKTEPFLGAVAIGTITLILGSVISLVFTYQGMQQMLSSPPLPDFGAFWLISFVFGALCGTAMFALFGAFLGAMGGAIGDALTK